MANDFRYVKLSETVAAAPQLYPEDMPRVAEAGYRVVINNRPDGEVANQPGDAVMRAAAEAAGLDYVYYPVNAFNYPGDDIALMARYFDDESRPVLAFCRSGTRSTNLWVSSRPADAQEAARARARSLGFDTSISGG